MRSFLLDVSTGIGATILGASAVAHLRRPSDFARALAEQSVVRPIAAHLKTAFPLLEATVAVSFAVAPLAAARDSTPSPATSIPGITVLLVSLFLLHHLTTLWLAGYGGTCGCTHFGSKLRPTSFIPATTLGAAGLLQAVSLLAGADLARSPIENVIALLQGATIGSLVLAMTESMPVKRITL